MSEWIIFIKTDDFDIDVVMKETDEFDQELIRGPGLASCEEDDLVHVLTEPDYKIRYTCIAINVYLEEAYVTLKRHDEYKKGIPLSFLEENGIVKKRAHKHWDLVDGLYNIIKHEGKNI